MSLEHGIAATDEITPTHPRSRSDVQRDKMAIRRTMRRSRAAVDPDDALERATRACTALVRLVGEYTPGVVALYAARSHELTTSPAALALLERGIPLAYPRVVPGKPELHFHRVSDLNTLQPGYHGIAEPSPSDEPVALANIELFVVPGLAFDRHGGRLGWGAGYYDATLAASPGTRVGFCFKSQILDFVPRETHDILMDRIVTDDGILDVRGVGRSRPIQAGQSPDTRTLDADKNG